MTEEEEQYDYEKTAAKWREKNQLIIKIMDDLLPKLENPDSRSDEEQLMDKETFLALLNHFTQFNFPMPDRLATHISKSIKDGTITYGDIKYEEKE